MAANCDHYNAEPSYYCYTSTYEQIPLVPRSRPVSAGHQTERPVVALPDLQLLAGIGSQERAGDQGEAARLAPGVVHRQQDSVARLGELIRRCKPVLVMSADIQCGDLKTELSGGWRRYRSSSRKRRGAGLLSAGAAISTALIGRFNILHSH